EHTSELQSRRDLVCRLLLEKSSDVCSDRKSTRLNSSHLEISYAVFCLNKENKFRRNIFRGFEGVRWGSTGGDGSLYVAGHFFLKVEPPPVFPPFPRHGPFGV